jgi:hypothetical protein
MRKDEKYQYANKNASIPPPKTIMITTDNVSVGLVGPCCQTNTPINPINGLKIAIARVSATGYL